jgi:hypothetical protein
MNKFAYIILFFLLPFVAEAQYSGATTLSLESLYSTGNDLPFWFSHNQSGRYVVPAKANQLLSLKSCHSIDSLFGSPLGVKAGIDLSGCWSDRFTCYFNELYGEVNLWNFKLEGGWFNDPDYFDGLSSTNGNMARSLNAPPYPKVRFGTNEYIPLIFFKKWFTCKAEYDEGWLGEEQYIRNARLHHKSLYLRFRLREKSYFTFGLDHYIFWGGTSPTLGKLPDDFKSYMLYVTGRAGSSSFPESDQLNVAGNQLGTYLMQLDRDYERFNLKCYYSHPFEDHSGMEYDNWKDNLLGVSIEFKKQGIIEKALYEVMFTMNQSGPYCIQGVMRGCDSYFNHGEYLSGFTYKGYILASPLFSPVIMNDSIAMGIENNRLLMHHFGLEGSLATCLHWEGLFTFSHNLGTYGKPYTTPKNEFSSLLRFNYINPQFPVNLSLSLAGDIGSMYQNRLGVMIRISKTW